MQQSQKQKETQFNHQIKLHLLGAYDSGKTQYLMRMANNNFESCPLGSGINFRVLNRTINEENIKFFIWDPWGQERFTLILPDACYKNVSGYFITFDLTSYKSFEVAIQTIQYLKEKVPKYVPRILVGCKADLEEERVVGHDQLQALANEEGIPFFETSAKTGQNCQLAFDTLSELAFHYDKYQKANSEQLQVQINKKKKWNQCF